MMKQEPGKYLPSGIARSYDPEEWEWRHWATEYNKRAAEFNRRLELHRAKVKHEVMP
jgi:hypothetical protein